jgi:hypothetical protein
MSGKRKREALFKTTDVDCDMYMSADLVVNKGVHEGTLEFVVNTQRGTLTYTMYDGGLRELHTFLTEHLKENDGES